MPPGSRANNFALPIQAKRKQMHSIGLAAYNSNPSVPTINNGLSNVNMMHNNN